MNGRRSPSRDASIYLVGMMGSGKTTLGEMLAARLHRPFVDTDDLIEARTGSSVRELFHRWGEARFRELEWECLLEVSQERFLVVALGGGAVTRAACRRVIRETGFSIYLKVRPETILARLPEHPERPLLLGKRVGERLQVLRELLAVRERHYLEADLIVENENSPWEALEEITRALERQGFL